jgi:hypothetical protein
MRDGNDFAVGGATSTDLQAEVADFLAVNHFRAPSSGLYTLSIGANNIFADLNTYSGIDEFVVHPPSGFNVTSPCWTGNDTGASGTLCSNPHQCQAKTVWASHGMV